MKLYTFSELTELDGYTLKDISKEEYRSYYLTNGSMIRCDHPIAVYIKKEHHTTHRVVDILGEVLYIPEFVALKWKDKESEGRMLF